VVRKGGRCSPTTVVVVWEGGGLIEERESEGEKVTAFFWTKLPLILYEWTKLSMPHRGCRAGFATWECLCIITLKLFCVLGTYPSLLVDKHVRK